jgi:hypothetical protein
MIWPFAMGPGSLSEKWGGRKEAASCLASGPGGTAERDLAKEDGEKTRPAMMPPPPSLSREVLERRAGAGKGGVSREWMAGHLSFVLWRCRSPFCKL